VPLPALVLSPASFSASLLAAHHGIAKNVANQSKAHNETIKIYSQNQE